MQITRKKSMLVFLSLILAMTLLIMPVYATEKTSAYIQDVPTHLNMTLTARYDVDPSNPEGGLEIVTYDSKNHTAYAVDGINSLLIAVPFKDLQAGTYSDLSDKGFKINLAEAAESTNNGFEYGDITSVAVSPDKLHLAVAIQAKGYNDSGLVAVFPIDNSQDTLGTPTYYTVGIQPDMVIFSDNATLLSADEGEPRMGYGVNSAGQTVVDPKGSVSIINLTSKSVNILDFTDFDPSRDALTASGVIMTKDQAPSLDLEPEYITVSADGQMAYVALQENNAIATVDVKSQTITHVYALGFKDLSDPANKIYLDGSAQNYDGAVGAYMPDGIHIYEKAGQTYILTANEGDGREWSSTVFPEGHEDAGDPNDEDTSYYSNEKKVTLTTGDLTVKKVRTLDPENTDGLPADKTVLFGGRSFSIFKVESNGLNQVYDSGSDFEDITSALYPDTFNASNTNLKLNNRSLKKGPEPENVTTGQIDGHNYAFVTLERMGGVMAYDITDLDNITYSNYINTRDFDAEDGIGGDVAPEGIDFIPASDSVTGEALLITGCEVTGTMPVISLTPYPSDLTGKLVILHTNDTHGADKAVKGDSIGTAGVAKLKAQYEAAGADVLLISAGDVIQGDPLVNLSKGQTAIDFMNLADYDFMTPGNHEFDYGYDNLLERESQANFPFVSANILDKTSGEPVFKPYEIFDTSIGKVGVLGLTTPESLTKANPKNVASLSFPAGDDMYKIAQAQVDALKASGCVKIVAVGHLGTDEGSMPNTSTDVINHVTGIDLFIDGHSHSVIPSEKIGSTLLTSAGSKLEEVGVVTMDQNTIESHLITASDYSAVDTAIDAEINTVSKTIDEALSDTFANTEVLLDGNRSPGVRTQETNLGDFAADAMLWAANQAVGEGTVDAAITNGGGIRESIQVGPITMKDMKTVFPFGNTISTLKITGSQLLEVLEASTYSTPDSLGAFPQVAGISFTINTAIPYTPGAQYPNSTYYGPANPGTRVTDVMVAGQALDLNKTYTIATNDFLTAGGDTYYVFSVCEDYNTYVALEDAMVNYTQSVLDNKVTASEYGTTKGRITLNTSTETSVTPIPALPVAGADNYVVKEGDTLTSIAKETLGDSKRYMEIYTLNMSLLTNPNLIYIGQTLAIPEQ